MRLNDIVQIEEHGRTRDFRVTRVYQTGPGTRHVTLEAVSADDTVQCTCPYMESHGILTGIGLNLKCEIHGQDRRKIRALAEKLGVKEP